jgi:hypothetical protein
MAGLSGVNWLQPLPFHCQMPLPVKLSYRLDPAEAMLAGLSGVNKLQPLPFHYQMPLSNFP